MQSVKHPENNIHPIFDEFDRLYSELSVKKQEKRLINPVYDISFKPLIELFKQYSWDGVIKYADNGFKPLKTPKTERRKSVIVCFSGGKDSIATVEHYIKAGYTVYLYHLKRINPPLYDECIQAEKLAEYWGIPIYIDSISLSGKHDYIEHPMKNMLIANGALQYGIKAGITSNIAFGNYTTSSLEYDNFEFCGGDDFEMWDVYNSIIQKIIPGFKVNVILENIGETLDKVCKNKKLLDLSVSCLGRASMRKYWHDWVKRKFNVDLPTHRCGRCYKCCMEYIYMADHGLQKYDENYYQYCFNNLRKNVEREDERFYNDECVWNHYFFYDMSSSAYYKKELQTT